MFTRGWYKSEQSCDAACSAAGKSCEAGPTANVPPRRGLLGGRRHKTRRCGVSCISGENRHSFMHRNVITYAFTTAPQVNSALGFAAINAELQRSGGGFACDAYVGSGGVEWVLDPSRAGLFWQGQAPQPPAFVHFS